MKLVYHTFSFLNALVNLCISCTPSFYLALYSPHIFSNPISSGNIRVNHDAYNLNCENEKQHQKTSLSQINGNVYMSPNELYKRLDTKQYYMKLAGNFKNIVVRAYTGFSPFIIPIIGAFYCVSNITKIFFLFIFVIRVLAYFFDELVPLCTYTLPIFATFSFIDFIIRVLPYAVDVTIRTISYLLLRKYSIYDLASYELLQVVLCILSLFFFYLTCYSLKGTLHLKRYKTHEFFLLAISYVYIKFESTVDLNGINSNSFLIFCYTQLRSLSAMIGMELYFEILFTFLFWMLASVVCQYFISIANKKFRDQCTQQFF